MIIYGHIYTFTIKWNSHPVLTHHPLLVSHLLVSNSFVPLPLAIGGKMGGVAILTHMGGVETIHKEYLGPYFINYANFDAMRHGQFGLENERLLKNILQSMNGSFMLKQKATETGIKSCDSVIKILETHIK